jgi:glycosyltransferase involved in cell wall biosynthesis
MILSDSRQVTVTARTSQAGIRHAFSQPAWDIFPELNLTDVNSPDWGQEELRANRHYSSRFKYPISLFTKRKLDFSSINYSKMLETYALSHPYQFPKSFSIAEIKSQSTPEEILESSAKMFRAAASLKEFIEQCQLTVGESCQLLSNSDIHITFGNAVPHISNRQQRRLISVVVEHGQMRWIKDGPVAATKHRTDFFNLCKNSQHIWVTNVDRRSLEIAEELFPSKWSLIPHPYVLDDLAPYVDAPSHRDTLCELLDTEFLLFSPSSISLGGDQQKGTDKLLKALAKLRYEDGLRVGAIFVNWGRNVHDACALIEDLGISDQCRFVNPLTRVALQTFMSNFDLISDQFDYDAFGSLTIRALEQGMPLLSKAISDEAGILMGRKPPVIPAATIDEIQNQIRLLASEQQKRGREEVLSHYRIKGRDWVLGRHHQSFTRQLQIERYEQLLSGQVPAASPGRWGEVPDWIAAQ